MSFYEKYVNSKFYHITDFFFKMVTINILMILTTILGLVIYGLPLSLLAGVLTMRVVLKKGSTGIVKMYFRMLKQLIKKSTKAIIFFDILIILLGFNIVFFYAGLDPFSWYYFFSFMIMILLFALSIVAFMHGLILSSVYDLNIKSLARHSYLLTIGFSFRGLIWLVLSFLIFYSMILIPVLGLIIGFSVFAIITHFFLTGGYEKVESLEEKLEEFTEQIAY